MPTSLRVPWCALSLAGALAAPTPARAADHDLTLSPRLGVAATSGPGGGVGPAVEFGVQYGLNDAFSLYGVAAYDAAFFAGTRSPRHGAALAFGALYAFDVLRFVPYFGVGVRGDLFVGPRDGWVTPSAEARVGLRWLLRRDFALSLEAAYGFPFVARDLATDLFSITAGVTFLRTL